MSATDPSRSVKNYYARRSSHHTLEASWLNTSGKRRCSLKTCTVHMTAMRLKACHFHRQFRSPSPRPSHLATFLAPCHVPRSSPRPWHLATFLAPRHPTLAMLLLPPSVAPLPEHKLPHLVLHSPPHLVPASLYARDAAGCYSQKPRRHAVNHAEQAHGRRPPQRRRVRRKKPR